ncbi:MAG: glutamate--tRNA ligase [Firmicutes bacterium]|nr:glutamate--tRNA ligase [Bacillota bacterium]
MDHKLLANLLFPNLKWTREEIESRYPKRNLSEGAMVTRFAPSPTGFIHMDEGPTIGGNYGPYIQSERKEIYEAFVYDLLLKGYAYPAFEKEEELEQLRKLQAQEKVRIGYYGKYAKGRELTLEEIQEKLDQKIPYVIRLKAPGCFDNKFEFKDCIKGKIQLPSNDMDIVLLKRDGLPTYHFAHVVDDYLMHTTHVVRGDEWLSSVPIHLQLFRLLEVKPPKYAHIAPLTKKDGESIRKLSKRYDKECSMDYYQKEGIPNEAIQLYLGTILNASFEDYYLMNKATKVTDFKFEFQKMGVGGSLFDLNKLHFISKVYLSRLTATTLYEKMIPYYREYDNVFYELLMKYPEMSIDVLNVEREIKKPRKDFASYSDIKKETWYMYDALFFEENHYERAPIKDSYQLNLVKTYFQEVYEESDSKEVWYQKLKEFISIHGYAKTVKEYQEDENKYIGHVGDFCEMIRVYLLRRLETPDIYELLKILGKERIQKRLQLY